MIVAFMLHSGAAPAAGAWAGERSRVATTSATAAQTQMGSS